MNSHGEHQIRPSQVNETMASHGLVVREGETCSTSVLGLLNNSCRPGSVNTDTEIKSKVSAGLRERPWSTSLLGPLRSSSVMLSSLCLSVQIAPF
jgi:hypothetical protein